MNHPDKPCDPLASPYGMAYVVYILASRKHGTLYTGVTNDLARRVWEHREKGSGVAGSQGVMRCLRAPRMPDLAMPQTARRDESRNKASRHPSW